MTITSGNRGKQSGSGSRLDDDEFGDDDLVDILDLTQRVESNHLVAVNHSPPTGNKSSRSERLARLDIAATQSAALKSQPSRGKDPPRTRNKRKYSSSDYGDEELERLLAPSARPGSSSRDPHLLDGSNKKPVPDHGNGEISGTVRRGEPAPEFDSSGTFIEPEDSLTKLTSLSPTGKQRDTEVFDTLLSDSFASELETPDRDTTPVRNRRPNPEPVAADTAELASTQDGQQAVESAANEVQIDPLLLEEFGDMVNFID